MSNQSQKQNVEPEKQKGVGWRTMHYFWQEIVKYKWYSLGCFIITPIVVFIRAILAPLIFADLIEKASMGLSMEEMIRVALVEVTGFLLLYTFNKLVLEELRLYWTWKMELKVIRNLFDKCFRVVTEQSMQFHSDRFSGSLVSQCSKFVYAFERFFDTIIWDLLPAFAYIVMVVVVLVPQVPGFAFGIVMLVVLYGTVSGLSFKKISHLNNEASEAESKQTGQLADSISNIISVKSYAKEAYEHRRFDKIAKHTYDVNISLMRSIINRDLYFGCIQVAINALILIFLLCGREWLGISVATLILIVNYSQTIMGELWGFNSIFKNLNKTFGNAYEMTLILDTVDDVVDAENATALDLQQAGVEFDHISFKHKDAKESIFEDFNLEIQPGERVGLVGVSGSGKTTLTKLLLRFADVDRGAIKVSGEDIKDITQESLRENIAYVPQETSLFHRSIADNIAYARPDAGLDEIKKAAYLANAHEFIKDMPEGYDTLVGERGVKLSGGQRQRIAIARAILKDAPILVLDEATSALDSESEALIQDALSKLMQGRTSIVIAHRLSTVAELDRIIVLQDGKIVEQGTHQELLNKDQGVYKHLWSRQSGAFFDEDQVK